MAKSKTFKLDEPISFPEGGQTFNEVTVREPTAQQLNLSLENSKTLVARDIRLISLASGTPESIIGQLPLSTFTEISDYIAGFMQPSQKTTGS